jgi:2-methylcitrate dehydratase PrpD
MLKVAVAAAAAELLRLTDESVDGFMLLKGNDKDTLTAI